MIDTMFDRPAARVLVQREDDSTLRARIRGEYHEMPGLSLTLRQAARLFNLDLVDCARVLGTLVADGALWTNGRAFQAGADVAEVAAEARDMAGRRGILPDTAKYFRREPRP